MPDRYLALPGEASITIMSEGLTAKQPVTVFAQLHCLLPLGVEGAYTEGQETQIWSSLSFAVG